ncbi:MAG: hypothetical protein KA160_04825 [Lacibacter sp.]|nr:hypothetical protein [Lacibacter sp.]
MIEENINNEEGQPPNNDQQLNNHSTDEPIAPVAETSEIINPPSDINDMEVHHHAHDPAAPHHKKNWKSYFWEFLMLFLAITLGFLVENQREHYIEHIRAKEFAKSLVQDLQSDTTAITIQKKSSEIFIAVTDSLLTLSKRKLEGRDATQFSFYTRFMYWTVPITWNRATFEQIKNSGSLRYFKNYKLLEKLMKYNALVNEIEGEYSNHQTRGNMLLKLINEIIDPQYHHDLSKFRLITLDTMSGETKENYFSVKTESMENKRKEIREMLNMTVVQQRNLRYGIDTRYILAKELANELIGDLKKEYHLQ